MLMIIVIFFFSGLIEHVSSIECITCGDKGTGYHCILPYNLDGGDESNENTVNSANYDADYKCMSDNSFDPETGTEKLILRGDKYCEEIDIPNHRVHCCGTNNCNKVLEHMTVRTLASPMPKDAVSYSSNQRHISSIILITFLIIFQYFY